ncbi:hypothetical protein VTL71DRAFT_2460 [Oculimacula yallundae]|uniref:DUF6594 domain-containing protein n=1 Tax=Oculimacula yallundae TaxID=86028 RepID=A0ABR4C939_9HELO
MSFGSSIGDVLAVAQLATFGFRAEDLQTATDVGQQALEARGYGDNVIILNFRALQAQRIKEIQAKLLDLSARKIKSLAGRDGEEPEEFNNDVDVWLSRYVTAIRNYETLSQGSIHPLLQPQGRVSRYAQIARLSNRPHLSPDLIERITRVENGELNFRQLNKELLDSSVLKQAYSDRLWMGAFGGIALIGPMLLMSLHRDLSTSLITCSVATALFTIVLAISGKNLKGQEVLAATAAYAAALNSLNAIYMKILVIRHTQNVLNFTISHALAGSR